MSERPPRNSGRPSSGSGPRRDGSGRPPSRDSRGGAGGFSGRPRRDDDRPPRRDDDRPPRRDFGDSPRPPRRDSGDASRGRFDRDDRPPRRDFGGAPPSRGRFDRDDRGPRGDGPPSSGRFDRNDRAPRRDFGDSPRPPRRDSGDAPRGRFDRDDRVPRRDFGDSPRPPRRDFGDAPRGRFDRDDRGPRRDGPPSGGRFDRNDRAPRRDFGDSPRPPRRDFGDAPTGRGRFDRNDRATRGPRRDDDAPRQRFDRDERRPRRPLTAAQEKSEEVKARIGERQTSGEMSHPPERAEREEWIDEGSVRPRRKETGIRSRGTGRPQKGGRKEVRALTSVIEEFERALGNRASIRALKRYEAALQAFEAHRYEDARKILGPMSREYPNVSAVREMLGLCHYRAGQWGKALSELEAALALNPTWIFNHAVIEDCHRALGHYDLVEKYWRELLEASPHAELMAEGRIVMAGALADQRKFIEALALMDKASQDNSRPLEYHMRQWFVIADLYDKEGNVIKARQFFERIAAHDPSFIDVAERLSTLGA